MARKRKSSAAESVARVALPATLIVDARFRCIGSDRITYKINWISADGIGVEQTCGGSVANVIIPPDEAIRCIRSGIWAEVA